MKFRKKVSSVEVLVDLGQEPTLPHFASQKRSVLHEKIVFMEVNQCVLNVTSELQSRDGL